MNDLPASGLHKLTDDQWVARLNKLARAMDEACDSLHPSAWDEQTKAAREKWKKLALTRFS